MKNVFKVGKSFLRQTAKNKNLFFTITVLLLLFVSLQGQWSQLYAADKTEAPQKETAYPATPEGVVEAFVREDLEGAAGSHEKAVEDYAQLADGPGWDMAVLVADYKITKINKKFKTADVEVEFRNIGELYHDGSIFIYKRIPKIENIIFKLKKMDDLWKIVAPQKPPYINVEAVIKDWEESLAYKKNLIEIKRTKKVIEDLKKAVKQYNKNHGGAK